MGWEQKYTYAELKEVLEGYDADFQAVAPTLNSPEDYHCVEGTEGVECMECSVGYTKSGEGCAGCFKNRAVQFIALVGLLLVFAGFLAFIVFITKAADYGVKRGKLIMIGKVLASHMQLVAMAATFPLEWPSSVRGLFSVFDFASSAGESALSFACVFAAGRENTTVSGTSGVFYSQALVQAALPPLCAFACWVYYRWKAHKQRQQYRRTIAVETARPTADEQDHFYRAVKKKFKQNIVVSMIVILFLLQPVITKVSLRFFTCKAVGEKKYLEADYSVECWQSSHIMWALLLGAGMVVCYSFGIPGMAGTLLYRLKRDGKLMEKRQVYGFLFVGFKEDYYYWEVVIMLRKLFFAFIAVVLRSFGEDIQAVTALGFLTLCLVLQVRYDPYESSAINRAELMSLSASFITMMAGILLFSPNLKSGTREILSVCIVLANTVFLAFAGFIVRKPIGRMAKKVTSQSIKGLKQTSSRGFRGKKSDKIAQAVEVIIEGQRETKKKTMVYLSARSRLMPHPHLCAVTMELLQRKEAPKTRTATRRPSRITRIFKSPRDVSNTSRKLFKKTYNFISGTIVFE